ncbi:MAG: response regulator transcription factor [Anaerolineae bacterium]
MPRDKILVVDDEPNIIELAQLYLENEGFQVISAANGLEALDKIQAERPALVVLDLMLPELDGWEVCKRVRANSDLPIIMLTARDDDVDKIVGLELGADDYMTKPYNPRELVARVKAVLRRMDKGATSGVEQVLAVGPLKVDPSRYEATLAGQPLALRAKEFDLLQVLTRHQGQVLSREQLLNLAWGFDFYGETRTVDVHIAHLREKLKPFEEMPEAGHVSIETVWGIGYKLVVDG